MLLFVGVVTAGGWAAENIKSHYPFDEEAMNRQYERLIRIQKMFCSGKGYVTLSGASTITRCAILRTDFHDRT